jgi:hypothetical protein
LEIANFPKGLLNLFLLPVNCLMITKRGSDCQGFLILIRNFIWGGWAVLPKIAISKEAGGPPQQESGDISSSPDSLFAQSSEGAQDSLLSASRAANI